MRAAFFMWMAIPAISWGQAENPKIRLRLYDLAGMRTSDAAAAVRQAATIFRAAGIELEWRAGDPSAPEAHLLDESAPAVDNPLPEVISVRVVPNAGPKVPIEVLGRALPFSRSGAQITLFLDHLRFQASQCDIAAPDLLGYVLAHELGHVLLRPGVVPDISIGLMGGVWGRREFDRINHGALKFTRSEVIIIRRALKDRLAQKALAWSASTDPPVGVNQVNVRTANR
jgi:hypothetical protein